MGAQGWFTLAIVLLALVAMIREIAAPDLVMMAALFALAGTGILTPEETFAGFANPAVATVGVLFVVAGALREDEYRSGLEAAGFTDIEIEPTREYTIDDARDFLEDAGLDLETAQSAEGRVVSAFVRATRS